MISFEAITPKEIGQFESLEWLSRFLKKSLFPKRTIRFFGENPNALKRPELVPGFKEYQSFKAYTQANLLAIKNGTETDRLQAIEDVLYKRSASFLDVEKEHAITPACYEDYFTKSVIPILKKNKNQRLKLKLINELIPNIEKGQTQEGSSSMLFYTKILSELGCTKKHYDLITKIHRAAVDDMNLPLIEVTEAGKNKIFTELSLKSAYKVISENR